MSQHMEIIFLLTENCDNNQSNKLLYVFFPLTWILKKKKKKLLELGQ